MTSVDFQKRVQQLKTDIQAAESLSAAQEMHAKVRALLADYYLNGADTFIVNQRQAYEKFMVEAKLSPNTWAKYANNMSQPGVWFTHIEMRALAHLFQFEALVIGNTAGDISEPYNMSKDSEKSIEGASESRLPVGYFMCKDHMHWLGGYADEPEVSQSEAADPGEAPKPDFVENKGRGDCGPRAVAQVIHLFDSVNLSKAKGASQNDEAVFSEIDEVAKQRQSVIECSIEAASIGPSTKDVKKDYSSAEERIGELCNIAGAGKDGKLSRAEYKANLQRDRLFAQYLSMEEKGTAMKTAKDYGLGDDYVENLKRRLLSEASEAEEQQPSSALAP